jgi:hypothetical protein
MQSRTVAFTSAIFMAVLLLLVAESIGAAQKANTEAHTLPSPTGHLDIGTVIADWKHESRLELLSLYRASRASRGLSSMGDSTSILNSAATNE